MTGCASGQCDSNGGSGLCCNTQYYSAVIYPDGQGDCDGEDCGFARIHISGRFPVARDRNRKLYAAQIMRMTTPRYLGLVFIPNRCTHAYVVIKREAAAKRQEGL